MAIYRGDTKVSGIGKGFNPENAGTTGQFLKKTATGYAYDDIPEVTVDSELSDTSENPVQNKVVTQALQNAGNLTPMKVDVFVLGGGGGGGGACSGTTMYGGGGGGGEVVEVNGLTILEKSISVSIGGGGGSGKGMAGGNGGASKFGLVVAQGGGGGGGTSSLDGKTGGNSGGGGICGTTVGWSPTPLGKGNYGARAKEYSGAGGGGGAGSFPGYGQYPVFGCCFSGCDGYSYGGRGIVSCFGGTIICVGGGGNGGSVSGRGGGRPNFYTGVCYGGGVCHGNSGKANTGGGGAGGYQNTGGNGGSGLVMVRYPRDCSYGIKCATGGTITTPTINGIQYVVHTFTSNGTFCITE